MQLLSLVSPAFNEEESLERFYEAMKGALASLPDCDHEILFVDDHSIDRTPEILKRLAARDPKVRWIRLSRNSGMHLACVAGIDHAKGDGVMVMASDLQDPPDLVTRLHRAWRDGAQVVWGIRSDVRGVSPFTRLTSRVFYWFLNRLTSFETPQRGADVFLVDRRVADALRQTQERNLSLFALVQWLGFRQESVPYVKGERKAGRSKFGFFRRLQLALDSFTGFSCVPLRVTTFLGLFTAATGLVWAAAIFVLRVLGVTQAVGYASIMITVLILSGVQMVMLGTVGEYLWRTLEEARRRPRYFVEEGSSETDMAR
jgi:dolichol-phosphate mannosyltransferase